MEHHHRRVTVPGTCGLTHVDGAHYNGSLIRLLADEMHHAWRHMFDNWRELPGQHGSDAFPLKKGYKTPE